MSPTPKKGSIRMMTATLFPKQHSTVHDKELAEQRTDRGKQLAIFMSTYESLVGCWFCLALASFYAKLC